MAVDGAVILFFEDRDGRGKTGTTVTVHKVLPVPSVPKL